MTISKRMSFFVTAAGVFLLSLATLNHFHTHRSAPKREKPFVGFSLAPSSGTIAIDFANGTVWTYEVDGDAAYREVMERLSLYSSRHPAPPYREIGSQWSDVNRVLLRKARKAIGLPASADVGALSTVVSALMKRAEEKLSFRVSAAAMTVPLLPALYQDDVFDILGYVGVYYFHYGDISRDLLYEPLAAYSGYGFGLCEHWKDSERCRDELEGTPVRQGLTVHHAPNALMITNSFLWSQSELTYPHSDFTLGSDYARNPDRSDNETYWLVVDDAVKQRLKGLLCRKYDLIMFVGKSAPQSINDRLARIVIEKVNHQYCQPDPPEYIRLDNTVFAAARGAAEWAKRYEPVPLDIFFDSQRQATVEL